MEPLHVSGFCFGISFCNRHPPLHNPPPRHSATGSNYRLSSLWCPGPVAGPVLSWAALLLLAAGASGVTVSCQSALWWLTEVVSPTQRSVGLSREEGGGPRAPPDEAAYSAWRLNDAAGGEGRPHLQAVFKPLLVTHWLLRHWGRRASGQGQGWCGRVTKGIGHRGP